MSPVARVRPDWLDQHEKLHRSGEQRWRDKTGERIFTYDHLHGHVEVYNNRGRHLGVRDVRTGELIGEAVKGRRIDV